MEQGIFKIGPIRPPSEANSLLLRVTENCPWNQCKFCMLYKKNDFHTRPVADVKKDIDCMAEYRDRILELEHNGEYDMEAIHQEYLSMPSDEAKMCYQMVFTWLTEGNKQAIFLQDANTLVLRPECLIEIVAYVRQRFPEIQRITSYGRANTLARIPAEDFKSLRAAGLDRIHSGYESGSDKVLKMISKGATQEDEIIGGKKVKDAGIELSIYFMPGVGGKALSDENAAETAKVINEVNPDFVRLRTFILRTGSLMEDLRNSGEYQEQRDIDKLMEIRKMLSLIDDEKADGKITSDHIINLLQEVTGYMDKDLPEMLEYIDSFLALPEEVQKKYQLARRMGFPLDWQYLYRLQPYARPRIEEMAKNIVDEKEWEALLHRYTDRYI